MFHVGQKLRVALKQCGGDDVLASGGLRYLSNLNYEMSLSVLTLA